ncbi:hypothetical protein [Streptomyces sp. NPDC001914]|uniref:hypothetical protein n=1 Tax=Streptomyces sp. NPDC001914 TaxID=3364623 RepID=UPI0036C41E50
MLRSEPSLRTLRRAVGVVGAGALITLGSAPSAVADAPPTGLVLGSVAPIDAGKPGSTFEPPVTLGTKDSKALEKVWLTYTVTRGLDYADVPSNCTRWEIGSYDELPAKFHLTCEFDQVMEPGVVYTPELSLKALGKALYDDLEVAVGTWDFGPDEQAHGPVRGTAPAAKLVERPGAVLTGSGAQYAKTKVRVNTANTADYQVSGTELKGRVGDTVGVKVKFTNAGPAWVLSMPDLVPTRTLIRIPAGTTVVEGLKYCDTPAAGTYSCNVGQYWVDEGQVNTYSFKLKINKAVAGAKGSVALNTGSRPYDVNKANDKADILLDVEGGGSTGGSGSAGGSGSTGGSGSAGGSGSTGGGGTTGGSGTTGGGADTTGGSSATGGSGSATTGGDLAATGSGPALPLAGAAAAAVAAGAGAVLLVRRRTARR